MAKAQTATQDDNGGNQGILDAEGEGFTFDMSSQEADSGFPVLDAGVYDASVESCNYQISKSSGNPMWAMRFLITGPGAEVADKKVQVRFYQSFKPDQMGRAKLLLQRLGQDSLASSNTFNPKTVADDAVLVGATCRLRLGVETSDEYGKQNTVKGVLPQGAAGGQAGAGGFNM
jgi:hypothetical protein